MTALILAQSTTDSTTPIQVPLWITITVPLAAALLGALASFILGRRSAKSELGQRNALLSGRLEDRDEEIAKLNQMLERATADRDRFAPFEKKYQDVAEKLRASAVIHEYAQPVLLVGPRFVGKSSLLQQWYSPWDTEPISSTDDYRVSMVPVFDISNFKSEPHFADKDIMTDVDAHLKLRVYDFPGERSFQEIIGEKASHETQALRQKSGVKLGVVIICMFDAKDVMDGISQATREYYNGELFANLTTTVTMRKIKIERLILLFNKVDLAEATYPSLGEKEILKRCVERTRRLIEPIRNATQNDKIFKLATALTLETGNSTRGSSQVLGEAAVGLVAALAGEEAAADFYSAKSFRTSIRKPNVEEN